MKFKLLILVIITLLIILNGCNVPEVYGIDYVLSHKEELEGKKIPI